jgi:hypothetical protein
MQDSLVRIGFLVLGWVLGLSCSVFFAIGYRTRTRVDSGQSLFGSNKPLDPVLNTDPEVIDAIRQERYEKGQEPYYNEG